MKKIIQKNSKLIIVLLVGNLIYSFGVMAFIKPNGLITGGVTGLSLFLYYLYDGINLSLYVLILNIFFFLLGWLCLGKKFAISTLASTLINPLCIAVFELFDFTIFASNDPWIPIICSGFLIGLGLGIIMKEGSSTGGVDILAIMLNRKVKAISIGVAITVIDVLILLMQLVIVDFNYIIYGIVLAAIYSLVIDKVILTGNDRVELKIISKKETEIQAAILNEFDRGITLLHATTGYLHEDKALLLTVINYRELLKLKGRINDIDPEAFMIISKVSEVGGHGFSMDKKYLDQKDKSLK